MGVEFPRTPASTHEQNLPLSTSPTRMEYLLLLINLDRQSPWFIIGFPPAVVHSTGFDKFLTYVHHSAIIQSSVTTLKLFCTLSFSPSPPVPANHWSFYYLRSFVFSRMPYHQNDAVHSFSSLASFTS